MANAPAAWLIIITIAVYSGFLIGYGETVLDFDLGGCTDVVDCATWLFSAVGSFFDLITLGGFESPLPSLVQGVLLLFFALTWGLHVFDRVTDLVPG